MALQWDDVIDGVSDGLDCSTFAVADFSKLRQRYSFNYSGDVVTITIRERETLALIVTGLTVPQAAAKMGLSTRTVEFYVKNLRFKLKCNSKRDLIEFAEDNSVLHSLAVCYY